MKSVRPSPSRKSSWRGALCLAAAIVQIASAAAGQESFDDLVRRAQLALDTGSLREAEALFRKAADLDPGRQAELGADRGWVYVLSGFEWLRAEKYGPAALCYGRAYKICPSLGEAFVKQWLCAQTRAGWGLLDIAKKSDRADDWRKAEEAAGLLVTIDPRDKTLHYALGAVYSWEHKYEEAAREYEIALGGVPQGGAGSLKAFGEAAQKEFDKGVGQTPVSTRAPVFPPWTTSEPGDFQVYRRGRITVYHHNRLIAERAAQVLEHYLSEPMLGGLIAADDGSVKEYKLYLYRNVKEYDEATNEPEWAHGHAEAERIGGRYVYTTIRTHQDFGFLMEEMLPHELAHARFHNRAYGAARPYKWLYEGVAGAAQGPISRKTDALHLQQAAKEAKLIPMQTLLEMTSFPKREERVDVLYPQSRALVESLVEKCGAEKFGQLVRQLAAERPADDDESTQARARKAAALLKSVCGLSVKDMDGMIVSWANRHARDNPAVAEQALATGDGAPAGKETKDEVTKSPGKRRD